MIQSPSDILELFPVRKNRKQKKLFRMAIREYVESLGYSSSVEHEKMNCKNVVIGDPEHAEFLITAHYDTCARMPIPNLITPRNLWLYLLYQFVLLLILVIPAVVISGIVIALTGNGNYWILGEICLIFSLYLLMFGPANKTNVNDNSSGVIAVLEIARTLQPQFRSKVCFVLFDNEELGLLGSSFYSSTHKKAVKNQIVLNFDCVGEGDDICFFPTNKLKKDSAKLKVLQTCCGQFGPKRVHLYDHGFSVYPSDQASFPYGVGICALCRGKAGMYLSKIHTSKDTVLDYTNVNILRAAVCSLVSRSAME